MVTHLGSWGTGSYTGSRFGLAIVVSYYLSHCILTTVMKSSVSPLRQLVFDFWIAPFTLNFPFGSDPRCIKIAQSRSWFVIKTWVFSFYSGAPLDTRFHGSPLAGGCDQVQKQVGRRDKAASVYRGNLTLSTWPNHCMYAGALREAPFLVSPQLFLFSAPECPFEWGGGGGGLF